MLYIDMGRNMSLFVITGGKPNSNLLGPTYNNVQYDETFPKYSTPSLKMYLLKRFTLLLLIILKLPFFKKNSF